MNTERDNEKERRRKIRKDKTKTERFPTKVGNLNNNTKQNKNSKVYRRSRQTLIINHFPHKKIIFYILYTTLHCLQKKTIIIITQNKVS